MGWTQHRMRPGKEGRSRAKSRAMSLIDRNKTVMEMGGNQKEKNGYIPFPKEEQWGVKSRAEFVEVPLASPTVKRHRWEEANGSRGQEGSLAPRNPGTRWRWWWWAQRGKPGGHEKDWETTPGSCRARWGRIFTASWAGDLGFCTWATGDWLGCCGERGAGWDVWKSCLEAEHREVGVAEAWQWDLSCFEKPSELLSFRWVLQMLLGDGQKKTSPTTAVSWALHCFLHCGAASRRGLESTWIQLRCWDEHWGTLLSRAEGVWSGWGGWRDGQRGPLKPGCALEPKEVNLR